MARTRRIASLAAAGAALAAVLAQPPSAGAAYKVHEVNVTGFSFFLPRAVNANGQVVGDGTASGSERGWRWVSGTTTLLPPAVGNFSEALDVDDAGVAVGNSGGPTGCTPCAATWDTGGTVTTLGAFPPASGDTYGASEAFASSDNGAYRVGDSVYPWPGCSGGCENRPQATRWPGPENIRPDPPGGTGGGQPQESYAKAVNSSGTALIPTNSLEPEVYTGTFPPTELEGYIFLGTHSLSDDGSIILRRQADSKYVVRKNGADTVLDAPAGFTSPGLSAINAKGGVVGQASGPGGSTAMIWNGATPVNLNTQIPADSGWVLRETIDIGNTGYILGQGVHNGANRYFLLEPPPALAVEDTLVYEPDSGTAAVEVTVSLSPPADQTVTVNYTTVDGTGADAATVAGGDYEPASGTLTFAPGAPPKKIAVNLKADAVDEADESFTVRLAGESGAEVSKREGTVTITEEPSLSVADVTAREPTEGTAQMRFPVSRKGNAQGSVSVHYATADGTGPKGAKAGADYEAVSGDLLFGPGEREKLIPVTLKPDQLEEGDETLKLELSNASDATTISRAVATGTISELPLLSGLVKGTDGKGAGGVPVQIRGPENADVTTADDGRFSAPLPKGSYRVTPQPLGKFKPEPSADCVPAESSCQVNLDKDRTVSFVQDCIDSLAFGSMAAVYGCFKPAGDKKWETDQKFRLNGIDVEPLGKVKFDETSLMVTFPASNLSVTAPLKFHNAKIPLGGIPAMTIDFAASKLTLPLAPKYFLGIPVGLDKLLPGLEISTQAGETAFKIPVTIPKDLADLSGGGGRKLTAAQEESDDIEVELEIVTTNDNGLTSAKGTIPTDLSLSLGKKGGSAKIGLEEVRIGYDFPREEWLLGAQVSLPLGKSAGKPGLSSPTIDGEIKFRMEPFAPTFITVLGDGINKPLGPTPIFLQRVGLQGSLDFSAGTALDIGIPVGVSLFAQYKDPPLKSMGGGPFELASADAVFHVGYATGNTYFRADGGSFKIWNYELLSGSMTYYPLVFVLEAKGKIGWSDPTGQFASLEGNGNAFLDAPGSKVLVEGRGHVHFNFHIPGVDPFTGSARFAMTDKGIGACAGSVQEGGAGFTYEWGGIPTPLAWDCDLSGFTGGPPTVPQFLPRRAASGLSRAAASTDARTFSIPAKQRSFGIAVRGTEAPPVIEMSGPGGVKFRTDRGMRPRRGATVIPSVADNSTYVFLTAPHAGRWSVQPLPESSPVSGLAFARPLPQPQVKASLRTSACRRTLSWSFNRAGGRQVRFVESGAQGQRHIVTTGRPRGRRAFTPYQGSAGKREVLAIVEQNGIPRPPVRVASFRADDSLQPAAPKSVQAKRRGNRYSVSWPRVCAAAGYRVTVTRGATTKALDTTKPKATVTVPGKGIATVRVTSLAFTGAQGKSRQVKVR